jgi:ornithine cyclodeaminase/alanine dehydrogenase-like protein (mu-crystallin family)
MSEKEVTVFKSLGIAIEDVACAAFLYQKAKKEQKGKWIDFGEKAK